MGISWGTIPRGSRGANLDGKAPDEAQWPSHNYMHLMEQPTIFYAIAFTLALMDIGGGINLYLAWGYVGLAHRPQHRAGTVNIVQIRFPIFALATLCLLGLTVHARPACPAGLRHYRLKRPQARRGWTSGIGRPDATIRAVTAVGQRLCIAGKGCRVAAHIGNSLDW